jgi:hypothetical protein
MWFTAPMRVVRDGCSLQPENFSDWPSLGAQHSLQSIIVLNVTVALECNTEVMRGHYDALPANTEQEAPCFPCLHSALSPFTGHQYLHDGASFPAICLFSDRPCIQLSVLPVRGWLWVPGAKSARALRLLDVWYRTGWWRSYCLNAVNGSIVPKERSVRAGRCCGV